MDNTTIILYEDYLPLEWTLVRTVKSTILGFVIVPTILGNLLALWIFFQYPKNLRSPTHYFLANLALADLFVGIFSLPYLAVFSVTLRWYFGREWCYFWTLGHFCFCSSSILSTLGVCIERFVGVRNPLKHLRVMNKRTIFKMVAGIWILAGALSLGPFLIWQERPTYDALRCIISLTKGHVIVASVGIFHIPAGIMVALYYLIYRAATAPPKIIGQNTESAISNQDQRGNQVRLAKKLSFLVGFLIISYLPMFTMLLIIGFDRTVIPLEVYLLAAWLRYFNSCANPVLYIFSAPGYKKAFKEIMCSGRENAARDGTNSSVYFSKGSNN